MSVLKTIAKLRNGALSYDSNVSSAAHKDPQAIKCSLALFILLYPYYKNALLGSKDLRGCAAWSKLPNKDRLVRELLDKVFLTTYCYVPYIFQHPENPKLAVYAPRAHSYSGHAHMQDNPDSYVSKHMRVGLTINVEAWEKIVRILPKASEIVTLPELLNHTPGIVTPEHALRAAEANLSTKYSAAFDAAGAFWELDYSAVREHIVAVEKENKRNTMIRAARRVNIELQIFEREATLPKNVADALQVLSQHVVQVGNLDSSNVAANTWPCNGFSVMGMPSFWREPHHSNCGELLRVATNVLDRSSERTTVALRKLSKTENALVWEPI